jgi:DNA-binding LytR/AlgR family response regulator
VHTSLGEELILMRLADAVRELEGAEGLQVHRSWWIAKSGITDEKRVDGRSLLVLPNGTEVPVSRSYRAKAKAEGLIR